MNHLPPYFQHTKIVPVRDQGVCTSCWTFSVADMLADRMCMYTQGAFYEQLSVQSMLSCYTEHSGCYVGGAPELVYEWIAKHGLPLARDYPYEQYYTPTISKCKKVHSVITLDRKETIIQICKSEYSSHQNIQNMKNEIFLNGPIVGSFTIYDSFVTHTPNRVFELDANNTGTKRGEHSIEILGWCDKGYDTRPFFSGHAYWICRTSWGQDWPDVGMGSIFYSVLGINQCGIEARASSARPIFLPLPGTNSSFSSV
jgi:cathepsin B